MIICHLEYVSGCSITDTFPPAEISLAGPISALSGGLGEKRFIVYWEILQHIQAISFFFGKNKNLAQVPTGV